MVDLVQNKAGEYTVNLFAPDLHSFTTPIDHSTFYRQTIDNLKLFVAAGMPLDNPDVRMYRQSFVPAHSELTWILNNFTGYGEMARMVEFKDKAEKLDNDRVSVGLFTYPVLMSADILLYGAKWVPVGEDQRQHLEFTRDIATRMNNTFGLDLVIPETLPKQQEFVGRTDAPRIRSLRNPSAKMSKSVDDPAGTILLSDTPQAATKKIMSAETDNVGVINHDWGTQPGVTNLLTILSAVTSAPQAAVNEAWVGKDRYGDLKKAVADAVSDFLADLQSNLANVDEDALVQHLEDSEQTMRVKSSETLSKIQIAIGLREK